MAVISKETVSVRLAPRLVLGLKARLTERALSGIAAGVFVLVYGLASGAYMPREWRIGIFAAVALAAAALIGRWRIRIARIEWAFLAALTGLLLWSTASAWWWSDDRITSKLETERTLVYVVCALAVLLAVERAGVASVLIGTWAGITGVAVFADVKYSFAPPSPWAQQGRLLYEPLGYANGCGGFAAIGIALAVGLALAYPHRRVVTASALSSLVFLVPVLYYSSSRTALMALAVGLAAMLRVGHRPPRAVWVGVVTLIGLLASAVFLITTKKGLAAHLFGQNRPKYWRVAWDEYVSHPILGSGPGTFSNYFLNAHTGIGYARDAHSLFIETLAELGIVGFALVVIALGLPLVAGFAGGADRIAAAAAGAYVTYLIHTALDWDWELPAVTVAGLICGVALLISKRTEARELRGLTRVALLVPLAGSAVLAIARLYTGPSLPFGP